MMVDDITTRITPRRLATSARRYEAARARAIILARARDALIQQALADGWTHAQIAKATGLTRGRIGQLAGHTTSRS